MSITKQKEVRLDLWTGRESWKEEMGGHEKIWRKAR